MAELKHIKFVQRFGPRKTWTNSPAARSMSRTSSLSRSLASARAMSWSVSAGCKFGAPFVTRRCALCAAAVKTVGEPIGAADCD